MPPVTSTFTINLSLSSFIGLIRSDIQLNNAPIPEIVAAILTIILWSKHSTKRLQLSIVTEPHGME